MSELFAAIDRGDAGTVWQLAQAGASLDEIDEATQLTPLALAAEAGQAEIVRTLLEAGADPDRGGATSPLEAAVVEGHGAVVDALLAAAANVNQAVADGFTPLMTAAATGDLALVQKLLAAGARPGLRNDEGDTAITLAEDSDQSAVVEELLAARRRRRRAAPPEPAAPEPAAPQPAAPQAVVEEPPAATDATDDAPPDFERLRQLASRRAAGSKIRQLAAAGEIDLDGRDAAGRTALMGAAGAGETALVRALIAAGVEVDAADRGESGHTALVYAVRSPSPERHEIVALLAAAGADLDRRSGRGERTPLMYAAEADIYLEREDERSFTTTRQLIALGADLEIRDRRGRTVWQTIKRDALGAPTFSASRRRLHRMLRLLANSGARQADSHKV